MEDYTGLMHCYYPNTIVQDIFVEVHKEYFNLCPTKDDVLPDAPASVILMLTLLPVSVIPIMVYMVIKKSSVIDWETQIHNFKLLYALHLQQNMEL